MSDLIFASKVMCLYEHVVFYDGISESAVVDVFEGGEGTHGLEEGG